MWTKRNSCALLVGIYIVAATVENSIEVSEKKLETEILYPEMLLLNTYPKKMKSTSWRDSCTPMFIAVLFTVGKIRKQPKCPCMNEWVKKVIYTDIDI